jgi:hypothetical protein
MVKHCPIRVVSHCLHNAGDHCSIVSNLCQGNTIAIVSAVQRVTIMIQAIETKYNGYRFRSRLEARWAVFFDALGLKWEYEKEGFDLGKYGWYLPDFWIPGNEVWIEIKGQQPTLEEGLRASRLAKLNDRPVVLVWGVPRDEDGIIVQGGSNGDFFFNSYPVWCDLLGCQHSPQLPSCSNCPKVQGAYEAARSARFEYGEMPKLGKID